MAPKKKKIAIISRESDSKTLDVAMLEAELKFIDTLRSGAVGAPEGGAAVP